MVPSTSTFATLRALQLVITDALDDIQRVFSQSILPDLSSTPASQCSSPLYPSSPDPSAVSSFPTTPSASFPPTPLSASFPSSPHADIAPFVDYPSPDSPFVSNSPGEQLALHPDAAAAASRIVAACGQMSNIVHKPFLSLCDAIMSYNLPACMRLVEHLHVAEILREAEQNRQSHHVDSQGTMVPFSEAKADSYLGGSGPIGTESIPNTNNTGLHVSEITNTICSYAGNNYIDPNHLVHALRLLSTHHIFQETKPDTFALTRVASLLDSGKSVQTVFSGPETKYDEAGATPAFVALITDELFKSAAYLTEAFTGVRLPMQRSTVDAFPVNPTLTGVSTLPSTSGHAANDPPPCTPTMRSPSALTHIVYPEDESIQTPLDLLPSMELQESVSSSILVPSMPLTTPSLPPPRRSRADESTLANGRQSPGDPDQRHRLAAFNLAFHTTAPFFDWLENGGEDPLGGVGYGACIHNSMSSHKITQPLVSGNWSANSVPAKSFRLDRFSKAMIGTVGWEAPSAILGGFDWYSLPKGSTIVDVGGGIGSTTMILARALSRFNVDLAKKKDDFHSERLRSSSAESSRDLPVFLCEPSLLDGDETRNNISEVDANFRFVVQDRPIVTALGIEAWRSKWPEILESGQVIFQEQDFFEPQLPFQPLHHISYPAVYLLRLVLHDWPDELARRILINLRVASNPATRLVIAEHVLPLACVDEDVLDHAPLETRDDGNLEEWSLNSVLANIEGAERTLVPAPLLSNLGKASANAYWMDLIMHISLNGKERTLREFCALALSAGWRVMRMTRPEGSLFAYLVCETIALPDDAQAIYSAVMLSSELSAVVAVPSDDSTHVAHVESSRHKPLPARPVSLLPSPVLERSTSRCGTPTFGSRIVLPKDEDLPTPKTRGGGVARKWLKSKGLGVRSVMIQKAEKQKEEHNPTRSASAQDDGIIASGPSSSHIRVWWKKSHPNSTSSSRIAVNEQNGEVPDYRTAGRGRRGDIKSNDSPSTPSPNASPVIQNWPSIEPAALSTPDISPIVSQVRRPSVASITRKLSFATFSRRPSIPDISEPLPIPSPSATLMELAPPPALQGDTERRSQKHLPSSSTLQRSEINNGATTKLRTAPRRSTLSFTDQVPPVPKSAPARRPDFAQSPKSSVIEPGISQHTNIQSSRGVGRPPESTSTIPRRQRRVTLSSSPTMSSKWQTPGSMSTSLQTNPTSREVRRIPSVPKLPHRLSIPRLRRKQSQPMMQELENKDRDS